MNLDQKHRLVEALLACASVRDRRRRDRIVDELTYRDRITRSDVDHEDIFSVVNTALDYEQGIEQLAQGVWVFEGGSKPAKELFRQLKLDPSSLGSQHRFDKHTSRKRLSLIIIFLLLSGIIWVVVIPYILNLSTLVQTTKTPVITQPIPQAITTATSEPPPIPTKSPLYIMLTSTGTDTPTKTPTFTNTLTKTPALQTTARKPPSTNLPTPSLLSADEPTNSEGQTLKILQTISDGVHIITGKNLDQYRVGDSLVLYVFLETGVEISIALLKVVSKNPETLAAQVILKNPDYEIRPNLRLDNNLIQLSQADLIPNAEFAQGYILSNGQVRLKPDSTFTIGDRLEAIRPVIIEEQIIDYVPFQPPIKLEVTNLGLEGNIAIVVLEGQMWPEPGTIVVASFNSPSFQIATAQAQSERDSRQENALQDYLDDMSQLIIDKNLVESMPDDIVRQVAQARTLSVLPKLDGNRKGEVLEFLYNTKLIVKPAIIDLANVNLNQVNLRQAYLVGADLSEANLENAILRRATLDQADLTEANLYQADLSLANLCQTDLTNAFLGEATLIRVGFRPAIIHGTSFYSADLKFSSFVGIDISQWFADFEGADFGFTYLYSANLDTIGLSEALFAEAKYDDNTQWPGYITPDEVGAIKEPVVTISDEVRPCLEPPR